MFSNVLVALASVSAVMASPFPRSNGLKISLVSNDVESISGLSVNATLTNTGSETVKFVKFGTVLDELPTRSFTVSKDDAAVDFIGAKISVVSPAELEESAWVTLAAGQSISAVHHLEELYDFEAAGTGAYSIAANTDFIVANADDVQSFSAPAKMETTAEAVTVNISKDVARRETRNNSKRAVVSCSNTTQRSFISASYTEAKQLATIAANYISSNSGSSLYTSYWKTNSPTTVRNRFTAVANENSSSRTLSCTDPYGVCTGGVIAYTLIATTNIYYCSIFYNEVATTRLCSGTTVASRNVRGGTTLHELTHAISGTDDVTYGCAADQALSASNQLNNADNYNCFATQVYASTQC